jgi:hypothetical protein
MDGWNALTRAPDESLMMFLLFVYGQLHAVVLAMFASIIAPFGGFFASGFKRSFKIKDFGDSIPGHGGMTDRMDCQVRLPPYLLLMKCVKGLFSRQSCTTMVHSMLVAQSTGMHSWYEPHASDIFPHIYINGSSSVSVVTILNIDVVCATY